MYLKLNINQQTYKIKTTKTYRINILNMVKTRLVLLHNEILPIHSPSISDLKEWISRCTSLVKILNRPTDYIWINITWMYTSGFETRKYIGIGVSR